MFRYPSLIRGAVSLEETRVGIRPWRLPFSKLARFEDKLVEKGGETAGIRLGLTTQSSWIELVIEPSEKVRKFDLVVDGELLQTFIVEAGKEYCRFESLPPLQQRIEIYFPQGRPVLLRDILYQENTALSPLSEDRPRWVTYGSSITQCTGADSPAKTWPAIVARAKGWELTCLGYDGECHLEPEIARMIRDLSADVISLCLGINVMGQGSLSARTFRSSVIGMISIIRESHKATPLYLISPIYCAHRETEINQQGLSLVNIRETLREVTELFRSEGDQAIHYIHGLDILGQQHAWMLPDGLHPHTEGYEYMAQRLLKHLG